MKLEDLIPGYHTVETRDGRRWLVLLTREIELCFSGPKDWIRVNHNASMYHISNKDLDILKVYCPKDELLGNGLYYRLDFADLSLIFEKEEELQRELTVDQISELLGYKVKIVGDK